MAKIYGSAGEHCARSSVAAFRKMFLMIVAAIAGLAFAQGVITTLLLARIWSVPFAVLGVAGFAAICWTSRYFDKRLDAYETARLNQRKGALGEWEVAAELEVLSDQFRIFHNVNTRSGNLDHLVVGPTGLFAIETKNWTGLITATPKGELMRNGRTATASHVAQFVCRAMKVREQVISLTHRDDFRIRAVMVFPKASIDALYGSTGKAHCVRLSKLRDYIEDPKFSAKLSKERVDELTRALQGISCMDVDFADTPAAGVKRTPSSPLVTNTAIVPST